MRFKTSEESYSAVRRFYKENLRMPSYSEMLGLFRLKSKNAVFKRVRALLREGLVEKDATGRLLPKRPRLPIRVLGAVQAGYPSPAEEELQDVMSLDDYLIANPRATFLLNVEGESMIDAGIRPGDLALVQRDLTPKAGDIVVANVDGEWTIKRLERRGQRVVLRAANSTYPAIIPRQELVVAGVVIAVVRKYR